MTRYLTLSAIAVAAAAGIGFYATQGAQSTSTSLPSFAAHAQEADIDISTVQEMALGEDTAPVTLIEYASFTCPHCANFHSEIFPRLKEDYIDTGKVRFVSREVYFDRLGLWAAMVARCSGDTNRYFGIADMIYEQQRQWTQGEPVEIVENLRRMGRQAGLTDDQLDACLSDGDKAQTLVAWYQENAAADGIEATPSFVINGETYRNMGYRALTELLDDAAGS